MSAAAELFYEISEEDAREITEADIDDTAQLYQEELDELAEWEQWAEIRDCCGGRIWACGDHYLRYPPTPHPYNDN